MTTMNVSLPDGLKKQLDERVEAGGYGTASEYVRELIRRDLARAAVRERLVEGASSPLAGELDAAWFKALRARRGQRR